MPRKYKKDVYSFIEVGEILFDEHPGHFSNLKSAIATVNTHARELGIGDINGKKSHRKMTAWNAEVVLMSCETSLRKYSATPIERAIASATAPEAPAEPVKAPITYTAEEVNKPLTETAIAKMTATAKKAEADAFELRRKNFYTDVNYFIKYAQSPEERLAIWDAIAKLYGLAQSGGSA